jgi:hypothetical protein
MTAAEIDPGELTDTGELITEPARPADRRHPIEVTVTRIGDHVDTFERHLTPTEIDIIAEAVEVLDALHARLAWQARRRGRDA